MSSRFVSVTPRKALHKSEHLSFPQSSITFGHRSIMSNLGQKIKEVFTGHHDQDKSDVKTPDVNAPGAFPSDEHSTKHHSDHNKLTKEPPEQIRQDKPGDVEKAAQHHTGHAHHDPEPETKEATSDAGNYPYWGNLPREGGEHVHRSEGPDTSSTKQHNDLGQDSSLAPGGAAASATAVGAGYLGTKGLKDHGTDRTDDITQAGARRDSKLNDDENNTNKGAVGAGAAGLAGATYLATRDKDDTTDKSEKKSNTAAPSHTDKTTQHTKTSATTQKPAETATPTKTTSSGDNNSHKREEEALAAGAGAAGLAGAGYYASQKADKSHEATRDTGSQGTQGGNMSGSSHTATSHHDPVTEAQKATSAAGNYPYWENEDNKNRSTQNTGVAEAATPSKTTSSGDNDSHRKEQALAAGAGASGLAGVGYLASKKLDDRKEEKQSSPLHGQTTSGFKDSSIEQPTHASTGHRESGYDAKRATTGAGNYPQTESDKTHNDNSKELAAAGLGGAGLAGAGYLASNRADERKDEPTSSTRETTSGIAAPGGLTQRDTKSRQIDPTTSGGIHNTVVGAGSSEYSPPVGSSTTTAPGHQTQASTQPSQLAAQVAAQQAWNKQQPASPNTAQDTSKDNKNSDLKYAAAGAAFGAGSTGLAADYGQGKEHETNPRTDKSEEIASRAMGSDGKPHAPSSTEGSGSGNQKDVSSGVTSGVSGLAGQSGSSGTGSKVLHKCDNCGHDNDISRYFNKDAVFRSQN